MLGRPKPSPSEPPAGMANASKPRSHFSAADRDAVGRTHRPLDPPHERHTLDPGARAIPSAGRAVAPIPVHGLAVACAPGDLRQVQRQLLLLPLYDPGAQGRADARRADREGARGSRGHALGSPVSAQSVQGQRALPGCADFRSAGSGARQAAPREHPDHDQRLAADREDAAASDPPPGRQALDQLQRSSQGALRVDHGHSVPAHAREPGSDSRGQGLRRARRRDRALAGLRRKPGGPGAPALGRQPLPVVQDRRLPARRVARPDRRDRPDRDP